MINAKRPNTSNPQAISRKCARRFRGGAALLLFITLMGTPFQAQAEAPLQAQSLTIQQPVIDELGQLYNPNASTRYQAQWTQLIKDIAPNFRFAKVLNHTTCLPAPAYDSAFAVTKAASLKAWPIPGQAGCTREESFDEMVTYVDPRVCDANTLRMGYWLYFKKDGFSGAGHGHDWEGVIVELKRQGGDQWNLNQVIGSYHREYKRKSWTDGGLEKADDGKHPVMFVGWAHHAMHWNKGGRADVATTWYDDLRNSHVKLDSWNNLAIIPLLPAAARYVLEKGDYGDANPPLTKKICNL